MKPITGQPGPDDSDAAGERGLFTSRRRSAGTSSGGGRLSLSLGSPAVRGVAAGIGGLLIGYLVATVVLFPAAAHSTDLLEAPDLLGEDLTLAEQQVRELGLEVERVDTVQHPRAPRGQVLGQNPLPGQLVATDGSIRFTVSAGAVMLPIPAVVGRQMTQAVDLLEAAGFTYAADTVESEEPEGSVVGADPEPGTRVALPQMVQLEVSLGPPTVTVPRLIGMEEAAALNMLDSLGLDVSEVEERFRFGLDQGRVIEQEPAAGVTVEHGASVRIVVGRRSGG